MNLRTILFDVISVRELVNEIIKYLGFDDAGILGDFDIASRDTTAEDRQKYVGVYNALKEGHIRFALHYTFNFGLKLSDFRVACAYKIGKNINILIYACSGWIPIDFAMCVRTAVDAGDIATIRLLGHGIKEKRGIECVSYNDLVNEQLLLSGFRLSETSKKSLMQWAIRYSRILIVRRLIQIGCKTISLADFYVAISSGCLPMVKLLYETIADFQYHGSSWINHACAYGHEDVLRYFLEMGHRSQLAVQTC